MRTRQGAGPTYVDTGINWLREIPANWQVRRLRYLASGPLMYGANEAASETDPSFPRFVRITDISEDGSLRPETFRSLPSEIAEPYLLREGDILLARSGATVGKTFIYRKEWGKACFAGYLIRFSCNRDLLLPDFLFCFTQSHIYWSQVRRGTIQATIQNFSAEKYGEILLPLPPLNEQRAVIAFLDREIKRIDALIEKKQRQIELLQEKRTALISHAVTKGLDPNANMKASGVEWLGEIPEHWKTKRLKFVADISTGDKDTENNVEDGEYPFFVRSQTIERINSYSFDGEAVLTAGDGVGVAKVFHYINGKFDFHQRVYKFSNFQSISGKFFFYYIRELFREEVLKLSAKSTVDSLRLPMIQDFVFCVPTLAEQAEIVEHLEREIGRIENAVSRIAESIAFLREYRTSLISAAVTGKVDVRKEAA